MSVDTVIAHVDGASRGNPGQAAYGVQLSAPDGTEIATLSARLGRQTNNYAEYRALLAALEWALRHGVRRLRVRSDSELLVRQMTGVYKVKSPSLRPLYEEARTLAAQLDFEIRHVRREANVDADRLANEALDA